MPTTVPTFQAFRITQVEKDVQTGFVEQTLDDLDPGDVVIKVHFSDVNYKDALAATGKGRILLRPSCIGGIDLSGTVVSSTDARFKVGDAVLATGYDLGVKHHGGYAEYARLPAKWVVKLPPGMTTWEAMALGTAGFTAGLGIVRMEHNGLTPKSGPVIVNGATGGVGSIAIDCLAQLGYEVVALTGKASETEYLKGLGAKEVRLRADLDPKAIKPLDRAYWAGAVDNVGGDILSWTISTMKIDGVVASIGMAASSNFSASVFPFILRGASLLGVDSVNCPMPVREQVWKHLATDMRPSHLREIAHTVLFPSMPAVFEKLANGQARGRTVIEIRPS